MPEGITIIPDSAVCIAEKIDPVVIKGSIAIAPDSAVCVAGKVDPGVFIDLTIIPDSAIAISSAIDPLTIKGSITVTPISVSVKGNVLPPFVLPFVRFCDGDYTERDMNIQSSVSRSSYSKTSYSKSSHDARMPAHKDPREGWKRSQ